MTVQTSAGSTLAISSGLPTTIDATGFGAATPTPTVIGEITDLGEFGRNYNVVKHNPVGTRYTKKFKGSYDNGTLQLKLGRDVSDAGQVLLQTAEASDASFTFCMTFQDLSKAYFTGKVTSFKITVGTVDQITGGAVTIEIDSNIVEVAAP